MSDPIYRDDLRRLTDIRLAEARILIDAGKWPGAFYLAGYAVECALKACIARSVRQFEFPDRDKAREAWKHKWNDLVLT